MSAGVLLPLVSALVALKRGFLIDSHNGKMRMAFTFKDEVAWAVGASGLE